MAIFSKGFPPPSILKPELQTSVWFGVALSLGPKYCCSVPMDPQPQEGEKVNGVGGDQETVRTVTWPRIVHSASWH